MGPQLHLHVAQMQFPSTVGGWGITLQEETVVATLELRGHRAKSCGIPADCHNHNVMGYPSNTVLTDWPRAWLISRETILFLQLKKKVINVGIAWIFLGIFYASCSYKKSKVQHLKIISQRLSRSESLVSIMFNAGKSSLRLLTFNHMHISL